MVKKTLQIGGAHGKKNSSNWWGTENASIFHRFCRFGISCAVMCYWTFEKAGGFMFSTEASPFHREVAANHRKPVNQPVSYVYTLRTGV